MTTGASSTQGIDRFRGRITAALEKALELEAGSASLDKPRQAQHGEFAFPCFSYAKQNQLNPAQLAAELAAGLQIDGVEATAVGPFLNFRLNTDQLIRTVLADAYSADYGKGQSDAVTLVEFSSPNIAKPMHIGHLRSTVIGAALARLFEHLGHKVVRLNHLGDWGSQFGKLVAAWNRWGDRTTLESNPIQHLLDLYVRYHEEEKSNPDLAEEAKRVFQELESGEDNDTRKIWQEFTSLSLMEFEKIYKRLGTTFDYIRGESWYEKMLPETLAWLESRNVLEESQGATIVDLSEAGIKTPCLVKTAHGTTLYATRDIAAARSRWTEFEFEQALYVVGAEQKLHFQQLRAVLQRTGLPWWDRIEHIPFGLIRFPEGKLSTREGRVLALSDVLDRAVDLALGIIEERNPEHPDKQTAAEQVGMGAIVFHDLKHQRSRDVVFNWKEVLSYTGDTGPYLMYSCVRFSSILRKAGRPVPMPEQVDTQYLVDARDLFVALGRFPGTLRDSSQKREPMILAQYLLDLAGVGNAFYRDAKVLGTQKEIEDARLVAAHCLHQTLSSGLYLLGLSIPKEM